MTVAALFVDPKGPYPTMPGVEWWDEARDARRYAGPWPVVAHPPCARWCRLAKFVESQYGHRVGDDGGLFESALASVRRFGGVLEHPAESLAFAAFGIPAPRGAGWQQTLDGEWVCRVSQAAYGHRARKLTWLFLARTSPPATATRWDVPACSAACRSATRTARGIRRRKGVEMLHELERRLTPRPFAEYLVGIARSVRRAA